MATININLTSNKCDNRVFQIVSTMQQQLLYPNIVVFWSWGAKNFIYGLNENNEPTLRFKVNGRKFTGYVYIVYDWNDTYKIAFVSTRGNVKKEVTDVYFDNMQSIIDDFVEKVPEYEF